MNTFFGTIEQIEISRHLSRVTVKTEDRTSLKALVIDTPETVDYLKNGNPVGLQFKETSVFLLKPDDENPLEENVWLVKIKGIDEGELLTELDLKSQAGPLKAVVSTPVKEHHGLEEGMELTAMVKATDLSLKPME